MTKLTPKQAATLIAMARAAEDAAGGDFGFTDEVEIPANVAGHNGFAAVFRSLVSSGLVGADSDVTVNGKRLGTTQYDLSDEAWEIVGRLDPTGDYSRCAIDLPREVFTNPTTNQPEKGKENPVSKKTKKDLVAEAAALFPERKKGDFTRMTKADLADLIASAPAPSPLDLIDDDSTDDDWQDEEMAEREAKRRRAAEREVERKEAEKAVAKSNGGEKREGRSKGKLRTDAGVSFPLAIEGTICGETYKGTLLESAQVQINGTTYSSPFNAVNKLSGKRYNGWALFTYAVGGERKPIDDLRVNGQGFSTRVQRGSPEQEAAKRERKAEALRKARERVAKLEAEYLALCDAPEVLAYHVASKERIDGERKANSEAIKAAKKATKEAAA